MSLLTATTLQAASRATVRKDSREMDTAALVIQTLFKLNRIAS